MSPTSRPQNFKTKSLFFVNDDDDDDDDDDDLLNSCHSKAVRNLRHSENALIVALL